MVPSAFVELVHLPLGASGKLDRKALPKPHAETTLAFDAPQTAAERVLAPIWEDVLGVADIGRDQNFFELGGDSILAIQMAARARRAGLEVSPRLLLEHQTLSLLCAAAAAARPIAAEQGLLDGDVAAPPIVQWFNTLTLANPNHFNQSVVLSVQPGLDARVLERAVRLLVEHHDALRLRWDGALALRYGPVEGAYAFEIIEGASVEEAAARMQASLDPIHGPLSRMAYFPDRHRFVWVAHHLAVDAVSWGILLDDLDRLCRLLVSGREPALPPKTSSLREWTRALKATAATNRCPARRLAAAAAGRAAVGMGSRRRRRGRPHRRRRPRPHVAISHNRRLSNRRLVYVDRAPRPGIRPGGSSVQLPRPQRRTQRLERAVRPCGR